MKTANEMPAVEPMGPIPVAAEKDVARKARDYLKEHDVCLWWEFDEDNPPSPEIKDFLAEWEGDIFDLDNATASFLDDAIANIEGEWLGDDSNSEK